MGPSSSQETPADETAPYCIGIVASAGGIDALSRLLAPLPRSFPAAVVIVLHIQPNRPSQLAEVLARATELRVRQAQGGELLAAGEVFVAPPDRHVEVTRDGFIRLTQAPREHYSRPSGNPLFLSLAQHYGTHAIAIVLTGYDGDGATGLLAVKEAGGATIVQDEASSKQFSMPRTAIDTGAVDQVLDVDTIAKALCRLVTT